MTIRTLVLTGPHGSGKTTLGRRLAAWLGWPFHDEIGKRLRRERLARDPLAHAAVRQPDFDEAVFREELERDRRSRGPRVVETWHPGNLAYALGRSPETAETWKPRLREQCRRQSGTALVVPLCIRPETLRSRLTEPGPRTAEFLDFLLGIGDFALGAARVWGLTCLDRFPTDDLAEDEAFRELRSRIRPFLPSSCNVSL